MGKYSDYLKSLGNPNSSIFSKFSYLFQNTDYPELFANHSSILAAFFLIAMGSIPFFVLLGASDQTANDIGSKYLRFLSPRCSRLEILMGRFLGTVIAISISYFILCIVAAITAFTYEDTSLLAVMNDTLIITVSLVLYSIPFIALMSLCSVLVGSASLSALLGISIYFCVIIFLAVLGTRAPDLATGVSYLLPNATKPLFLKLDWLSTLTAIIPILIYTTVYALLAHIVFSKRDI